MKMLVVTLLLAISYAQTDVKYSRRQLQDYPQVDNPACACAPLPEGSYDPNPLYGAECGLHDLEEDSPFASDCNSPNAAWCGDESWCIQEWCYVVDGPNCPGAITSNRFGTLVWYSYERCENPDCYSYTWTDVPQPEDCPFNNPDLQDPDQCDCPGACIANAADWIGDGQCDRRSQGYDCSNCDVYFDPEGDSEGVFDGGDCDTTATTQDPQFVPHNLNVIDGSSVCSEAVAICDALSFTTPELTARLDGIDYDCLDNVVFARSGWFLMKMDADGDFRADLSASRNDDGDVVSHPIRYLVFGPFDSPAEAKDSCGAALQSPVECQRSRSSSHEIELDNVSEGKYYLVMVADDNDEPGTITIKAQGEPGLECFVEEDVFQCEETKLVDIDFTDETVVKRWNLAGYWAKIVHGFPNDFSEGIYYSKAGSYEGDDGTSITIGLRVTTTSIGDYSCKIDSDENACETVMTGLDTPFDGTADDSDSSDNHFGFINMFTGDVRLNFEFVFDDEQECNERGLEYADDWGCSLPEDEFFDRVKLSIFDIDSKTNFGEEIEIFGATTVCPGGLVRTNTQPPYILEKANTDVLDFTDNDYESNEGYRWDVFSGCFVSRSADTESFVVKNFANCFDEDGDRIQCVENNPANPQMLQQIQKYISVEAEWFNVGRDGVDINMIVSRDHKLSRNFMFSGESVSIGRKCCRDVFSRNDCRYGYRNFDSICSELAGDDTYPQCTKAYCCKDPSSHGDPIIHTFNGDCYDLHKDGYYLASSHPHWDHEVYVGVYNDYIRQITVTKKNGDIMLSVNNFGEIINNDWDALLKVQTMSCPENYEKEDCVDEYTNISFDALDLYFDVRVGMRHDYADLALKQGEVGYHMDIMPEAYVKRFNKRLDGYEGLYFYNPLPEEMPTCENR